MRSSRLLYLLIVMMISLLMSQQIRAQSTSYIKTFFSNSRMAGSFYYSDVTYQSPSWVANNRNKLPVTDSLFFTPGNSLSLHYISAAGGNWQAKILYHQVRGVDSFEPATQLCFRLYLSSATHTASLPMIRIEQENQQVSKAVSLASFISLSDIKKWIPVRIPLSSFGTDIQPDHIAAIAFTQGSADGNEQHLYLDQVELGNDNKATLTSSPLLLSAKGYEKHVDIVWKQVTDTGVRYVKIYRSDNNKYFYPIGIQSPSINRYADFTDTTGKTFSYKISFADKDYHETLLSNTISATTHTMSDSALLDMVEEAHFRYYWEGAEPNSGLALEDIPGRQHMIAAGASGFGMMALIVGAERHFITRDQLVQRFDRITSFLMKAETFHGAFPHFIDGITGKVVPFFGENDDGGDLVETAFLMQGLLAAQPYFTGTSDKEKTIRKRIDSIWQRVEWSWYRRDADSAYLFWHWSPDKEWIMNHRLIGWNETLITYLLAIASPTHAVPASMYYSGWASQSGYAQEYRTWGESKDGLHFTNGNTYYGIPLAVGVSDGGPLFFTHYSFMGLNPHQFSDAYTNYFTNNQNIALINYRYCIENPAHHAGYGAASWGLTASDGPWDYSADQPVMPADKGKIAPTGALASFPYTPEESMAALKNYYRNDGSFLWGEYGFRDTFNLDENWCSDIFMGLNGAPVTVMIENYRSGLLWKLFMSRTDIQDALRKLSGERPAK